MKRSTLWSWLWIVLGILYFFTPLYATIAFSLRAKKDILSPLAYQQVFADPQFRNTFSFSFVMASLTIVAGILLVVPTAYWVHLRMRHLRSAIEFVTLMPFVIPAIVLTFGLIKAYSGGPFYITNFSLGTDALLVGSYVVLALPYLYRAVDTGLAAIDVRTLTEAAQSLGASWPTIILRIILPNLRIALLSGAFLTFATVIGEYTIASFLVGLNAFGPYMGLTVQNKAYQAAALSIISFALTWASLGLIQLFSRGAQAQLSGAR